MSTTGNTMEFQLDLVGGPFTVIESDPGVFTSLLRKLGVRGLEVTELYSVEPFETDHLNPYGLILCYLCNEEANVDAKNDYEACDDLVDPDACSIWFANQLSDDACSSQAILNVILNCRGTDIGAELREFAVDTEKMSPVMRGLAISNSIHIRQAQNSLARPADVRGAYQALATAALESAKSRAKASTSSPPAKKRKITGTSFHARRKPAPARADEKLEAYHYIGYVPAHGRVWELDGLRAAGPLDVGEINTDAPDSRAGWMDVVRPVIQRRMQTVLHGANEGHIQYNLLAIVDDAYIRASDDLEMLKRERAALERRLAERFPEGWAEKVDPVSLASAAETFSTSLRPSAGEAGMVFAADFGSRKMSKELAILDMPERDLVPAWESCIRAALSAKVSVEDEIVKSQNAQADNVKRTFDYEPFVKEFIVRMQDKGLLDDAFEVRRSLAGDAELAAGTPVTSKAKSKSKKS